MIDHQENYTKDNPIKSSLCSLETKPNAQRPRPQIRSSVSLLNVNQETQVLIQLALKRVHVFVGRNIIWAVFHFCLFHSVHHNRGLQHFCFVYLYFSHFHIFSISLSSVAVPIQSLTPSSPLTFKFDPGLSLCTSFYPIYQRGFSFSASLSI